MQKGSVLGEEAPQLLTGAECAELLRLSRRTIRDMLRKGTLVGLVVGRTTRVTRESVETLFEQTRTI